MIASPKFTLPITFSKENSLAVSFSIHLDRKNNRGIYGEGGYVENVLFKLN